MLIEICGLLMHHNEAAEHTSPLTWECQTSFMSLPVRQAISYHSRPAEVLGNVPEYFHGPFLSLCQGSWPSPGVCSYAEMVLGSSWAIHISTHRERSLLVRTFLMFLW